VPSPAEAERELPHGRCEAPGEVHYQHRPWTLDSSTANLPCIRFLVTPSLASMEEWESLRRRGLDGAIQLQASGREQFRDAGCAPGGRHTRGSSSP